MTNDGIIGLDGEEEGVWGDDKIRTNSSLIELRTPPLARTTPPYAIVSVRVLSSSTNNGAVKAI